MTKRPVTNVAASVKQRLLNTAREGETDFNTLLTQYAIERFLYRLSESDLAERFVLKGAMLFRVWQGRLHRPTKDLDLLGYGEPTPAAVADSVRQLLATPVEDDGLTFDPATVIAAEIREDLDYGGIRVRLVATLGNARIPLQVDIGFGDAITPMAKIEPYPTLLEMEAPRLRMYPPETVVAEKLEAAVSRGMTNSRMKDYYDLLVIFRTYDLDEDVLASAIAATFLRRKTPLPAGTPEALMDEFGCDETARRLWREFLRRLQIEDAPTEFAEALVAVRERVLPVIDRARSL